MIELIKHGTNFDFVGKMKLVTFGSFILVLISLYGIFNHMNYGVDFRGGAEIQVKFGSSIKLDQLRTELEKGGFKGISVQTVGQESENSVLIKVQAAEGELNKITEGVNSTLKSAYSGIQVDVQKVDIVGPKAGKELRFSAVQAMIWALISIMVYIAIRFDVRFSPGAILSLLHDVIVTAGIIALTGREFSLQTVAALLAIIGYSINDTVDTISRTIVTSFATLMVSATMYFMGGAAIKDFFFAMTIGIILGTYSTVYIAGAMTILADNWTRKSKPSKNEKALA
jgi:preprotein translocase subunit SecF